jgi:phosphoglycolate phosphatase
MNIFFDLDGPILEVRFRHYRVYQENVRTLGGQALPLEVFWEAKRERLADAILVERTGLPPSRLEEFRRQRHELLESEAFLAEDLVQPEMDAVLGDLAKRHPLFLVTLRRNRAALERQLDHLNLKRFFQKILSGQESNTQPWTVKTGLIRASGVQYGPADWIIGDTETEILAGRDLGLRTVAVTNGIRSESILRSHQPDYLLPNAQKILQLVLTA